MNARPKAPAVAVSGGSDSLLALALLAEQDKAVMALHAHFLPPDKEETRRAAKLEAECARLGAEFHVADLSARFEAEVIDPFVRDYLCGLTPNPCAHCNRLMKFGALMDAALELGADGLATGHYARLENDVRFGRMLARGLDASKDQSYFLSLVSRERLERADFPLGGVLKRDVPDMLAKRGLEPPLPSESQEVCFVPGDDYRDFLASRGVDAAGEGPILKDGREIGRHDGLWRFTLGQRRGMRVPWSEPLYVVGKDARRNALIAGTAEELAASGCRAGGLNLFAPPEAWPERVFVQTRYRQQAKPAAARVEAGRLRIEFETPRTLPTPGQIAAVYDERGVVLAGGVIES
jgi:tRNA-specific 2-thiouridylase